MRYGTFLDQHQRLQVVYQHYSSLDGKLLPATHSKGQFAETKGLQVKKRATDSEESKKETKSVPKRTKTEEKSNTLG